MIDHRPASTSGIGGPLLAWSSTGELAPVSPLSEPVEGPSAPLSSHRITIPPLPPRREEALATSDLRVEELPRRSGRAWLLGVALVAGVGLLLGYVAQHWT